MYKKIALITITAALFTACASVPMESEEASNKAKVFEQPIEGHAGLYIYRQFGGGASLKKDIWINDKCVGESAPSTFFYQLVKGDEEYKISTESEFSPNDLFVKVDSGKNYFIKQYIKMGVFVGGADLEIVEPEEAKEDFSYLELAKNGKCSK